MKHRCVTNIYILCILCILVKWCEYTCCRWYWIESYSILCTSVDQIILNHRTYYLFQLRSDCESFRIDLWFFFFIDFLSLHRQTASDSPNTEKTLSCLIKKTISMIIGLEFEINRYTRRIAFANETESVDLVCVSSSNRLDFFQQKQKIFFKKIQIYFAKFDTQLVKHPIHLKSRCFYLESF